MYNVLRVLKKEFLQLRRDPRIFPIIFVAPILQLLFLGYAATLDIKHIPIITWDQDRSPLSRDFINHITQTLYFDHLGSADNYEQIERAMKKGEVKVALVIPPGFQRDIGIGRTVKVQAVIDGADSNQALIAQNYLSIIAQQKSAEILTERLKSLGPGTASLAPAVAARLERISSSGRLALDPQPRVWYNPDLRSANFMVPGVVVIVLLVITMMLTALAVVREKEVGTMEQVIVTPIKPWQFILGKLLPFTIVGFMEVTIVLLVAVLWFRVPFQGSVFALYGYAALFLLTTLGFGLFVSTISQNQQQAMMTAFFIMFSMMLLSGFMFPIENMPTPVQWLTYLVPIRYFLIIVRSLFLKGSAFPLLWDQALGLFCLGLVVIGLSVRRFRKTLD